MKTAFRFTLLGILICLSYLAKISPTAVAQSQISSPIMSLAWSPDGAQIVTGHENGSITMWDAELGNKLYTAQWHIGMVTQLAWKPDGSQFASGAFNFNLRAQPALVWDAQRGRVVGVLPNISETSVLALTWSLDQSQIIVIGFDTGQNFQIWDATFYYQVYADHSAGDYAQIVWSPDRTRIALPNIGGQLIIANPATFEPEFILDEKDALEGGIHQVYVAAWSFSGNQVASGNVASVVRIWDANTGQNLQNFIGTDSEVIDYNISSIRALHFSLNDTRITSVAADGTIRTWVLATGEILSTAYLPEHEIYAAEWSPDGTKLAYGGTSGLLNIIPAPE